MPADPHEPYYVLCLACGDPSHPGDCNPRRRSIMDGATEAACLRHQLADAAEIVRALAACEEPIVFRYDCHLCALCQRGTEAILRTPVPHAPWCPWRKARAWAEANPR